MKKKFPVVLILVLVLIIAVPVCGIGYLKAMSLPVSNAVDSTVEFEVKSGTTAKALGNELASQGIIKNAKVFYVFARYPKIGSLITGSSESIFKTQKGIYELSPSMTLSEVFAEVSTGKEKSVNVPIPEGLTITKIAERLKKAGLKNVDDFESVALHEGRIILESYGVKIKSDSVEGFLFPDTYNIPLSYSSEKIIRLMVDNFFEHLKKYKALYGIEKKDDFYQILILASIVEREYRAEDEAESIAGVFNNRLKIGMPLQSCATVEYIITEINHKPHPDRIYFSDLESTSPFNTYKYQGLPPSPISNPGHTALIAAVYPEKNNYLYFTLTDANAGRHTFSSNLDAHVQATNEFRTKRDADN